MKRTITLKKVYREVWSKKRGSANREFTGHTTSYFVDGVPVQEKDYISRIADIAGDESRFRLLTSPMVFPSLPPLPTLKDPKRNQRSILLEVCGDISDIDVILSNEKLTPLTAILGKHTLDDHRKIVAARRSEINREIEKIPVRIDEVRRGLPDITGIDRQASETEAQRLETALNDAKLRLQGVNTGGNIADLTKKLSGLNADLRKMEDAHRSGSLSTLNRLNQQISELFEKVQSSQRRLVAIHADLKRKDGQIQIMNADLAKLRDRWTAIDAETFKDTTVDTCPACCQALPPERVQEAREKALASFNQNKADRLGDVDRRGHSIKDQKEQIEKDITHFSTEQVELEGVFHDTETHFHKAEEERDALKASSEEFSGLPHHVDLLDEIEDLESQIKTEREGKAQDIEKIKKELDMFQRELSDAKSMLAMFTQREHGEKRIEELKDSEKKLSAEFEKLESELYLMDQFIKTKVSMLTDRINTKFEFTKFKLFDVQVNGGISDCCEITVGGVGYNSGLNSAARTQSGMDIIKTLQQFYGLRAPIFIDNRESCTEIPEMPGQVISLYVSPKDTTLRVETEVGKHANTR